MSVFAANTHGPIQPREEPVISIDVAVDAELRNDRIGAVVQGAAVAQFAGGQAPGPAVFVRTAETKPVQQIDVGIFKRREAHPADYFGLIRCAAGEQPLAVESAKPVFRDTAGQFAVKFEAGSTESSAGIR